MNINDFHTHNLMAKHAIINVPRDWLLCPEKIVMQPDAVYSVGIHPWWTSDHAATICMLKAMPQLLNHRQVVAVGECGIDRMQGADIDEQINVFTEQVALAEQYNMPITLHVVRAFDVLLLLHKQLHPTTQWTVHGFRGKPALATQLLNAGIDLSFGAKYNVESWALTPTNRRHVETDSE